MGSGDLATLVRICDPAGRPRGTGFLADHHGTVVTSHEAVDGLSRVVLHAPGDRSWLAEAEAVTPLPESGLALVRTEGLGCRPLPLATRPEIEPGTYVRIAAQGWREARVLGPASVTYTAANRFHVLADALELAIGTEGAEALRRGGQAAGGPVLDTVTGTVLAVLGTALHGDRQAAGYAVPLRPAGPPAAPHGERRASGYEDPLTAPHGEPPAAGHAVPPRLADPLADLLRRNAATVPAYGPDLNLAAILELTATSTGPVRDPGPWPEPVERPDCVREFARFAAGRAPVLALVGAPGTGRTTALAALCARRARGAAPAPTVRLRGADLRAEDRSLADAVGRALHQAGRIVAASGALGDTTTATPERAAALARDAGRPLLVVLDGPEEMPPLLAHRLADWTAATEHWLRTHGAHLVTACRPEHWEQAGALYGPGALHRPAADPGRAAGSGSGPSDPGRASTGTDDAMPAAVVLGPYTETEARAVREGYGIGETDLAPADARHPLALRLLAEVRAALPGEVPGRPGREEIFTAYLDLMCLRTAVRIAAGSRPLPRGTAVRRLAARVTGRLHEAARRCLGPGHGALDRASFEELFPWREGWAQAVLTEGLLVPAGSGYRFAHEELADWVQAAHLDLDTALEALVHGGRPADPPRPPEAPAPAGPPAPGPLGGPARPSRGRHAAPARPTGPGIPAGPGTTGGAVGPAGPALPGGPGAPGALDGRRGPGAAAEAGEPWASDAADRSGASGGADRPGATGAPGPGAGEQAPGGPLPVPRHRIGPVSQALLLLHREQGAAGLGPRLAGLVEALGRFAREGRNGDGAWWAARLLGESVRRVPDPRPYLPVLRLLADEVGAHPEHHPVFASFGTAFWLGLPVGEGERIDLLRRLGERSLDAVAALLAADPRGVQPLLCRWFGDPRPAVATAAQALLHTHRALAVDDLCEVLVATAHPLADDLLAALARDEPSALCRAVDRWAHDDGRPERRVAAAAYGHLVAGHVTTSADRELLRYAALALLARPGDQTLHGAALGLLVRDPYTRARHLPRALAEPRVPAAALAEALPTHPEEVLAAFRTRLGATGETAAALRVLAEVDTPALARRIAALVREHAARHPEDAPLVAAFVDRRLEDGPAARAILFPLVTGLIRGRPAPLRRALAPVLAAPGTGASRHLRAELLDVLLEHERYEAEAGELTVLEALLRAAAEGAERRTVPRTRELTHRVGALCVRTPAGAWRLDRALAGAVRELPAFAALLAAWTVAAPGEWAPLLGPETLQALRSPGTAMPMRTDGRGHGSLRPA
ncbi:trypsin-like peptidase domain-containing protein [Streptomyces vietnamensis]|uniref:trypsin-like peptidase domain-containing protein n=1 Tax=Streptomyces vietnamensis TaxID=362257 RepID=UPI003434BCF3